ncbi:unnamed protein product [Gemmataceae bacterium]|jgi:hypothetical protein|nr:unnamed protein product [Gemmataceae bacterium]VTT97908.1 unnamed protein product [Gemmataceae bacterium]
MTAGRLDGGRSVVPACRVLSGEHAVRIGEPEPASAGPGPKVELVREGGVVRAIEVVCSCGERITIQCEYG